MSFSVRNGGGDDLYQPLAEINVTPLVDVMLVLLIIFMVTAPLLTPGVKVDLPKASSAKALNPKEPLVVSVGRDGRLAFGSDEVTLDTLAGAVKAKMGDDTFAGRAHPRRQGRRFRRRRQRDGPADPRRRHPYRHRHGAGAETDRHAVNDPIRPGLAAADGDRRGNRTACGRGRLHRRAAHAAAR